LPPAATFSPVCGNAMPRAALIVINKGSTFIPATVKLLLNVYESQGNALREQ
jgi:hypothetical protein